MDDEFVELQKEFLAEAREKVSELKKLCGDGGPGSEDDRARVMNLTHQLKGAGGSYGYSGISNEAAAMEEALETEPASFEDAARHLEKLEEMVSSAIAGIQ